jgi:hypothetical protein
MFLPCNEPPIVRWSSPQPARAAVADSSLASDQRSRRPAASLLSWLALLALGCVASQSTEGGGERTTAATVMEETSAGPDTLAVQHWPLGPRTLEAQLKTGRLEILSERYAGAGLTGASRVELRLLDLDRTIIAKWKRVPPFLDTVNNSPRREIAAYEVQKLVLEPEDYVVPTSVLRCVPASLFPEPRKHPSGPLPGSSCELGVFSVWMQNVTLPDILFDPERFEREPRYARHLGNFNLATYLMRHLDGRRGNFLVSTNEADRRVFAVDNGVAFGGIWYNWFVQNWHRIRVPALPRDGVERLERVRQNDLEALAVVAQLRKGDHGIWTPTPPGPAFDEDDGARLQGSFVQFGLTDDEIEDLSERIEDLVEEVEEGDTELLP